MAFDISANRGSSVIACAIIFMVLSTLMVGFRFLSHRVMRRPIFLDDWLMIPAWIMMLGLGANLIVSVELANVGRHEDWVLLHHPEGMVYWSQNIFSVEVIYVCILATLKTSILAFYLRIFQIQRWLRWMLYGLIAYLWMWWVSVFIAIFLQCQPLAYLWDLSLNGTCFDRTAFYRWLSVPSLVHDVALLVIPVPMVWNLQMPIKQKVALCCVFIVGSLGCVASAIRMYYFFKLNGFSDDTWASVELMSWTCAEPGVILVSACMPALWPLFRQTFNHMSSKYYGTGDKASTYGSLPKRRAGSRPVGAPNSRDDDHFMRLHDLEADGTQVRSHMAVAGNAENSMRREYGSGVNVKKEFTWSTASQNV